ncbi:hypothetical protein ABZX56_30615 [Streptomyces parvulus]|uniref:hypothetical protein n=1 Tax=Streptomyces parvulus TaxID=146923 RepID=UPI0033AA4D13
MIRAGRAHLARTLSDLARAEGRSLAAFKKSKLHKQAGHPGPISSPTARVLLWDAEQTEAFRSGQPVPLLPGDDDPEDLLDQHEAAALVGLSPRSWEVHKKHAELVKHMVLVRGQEPPDDFRGVEHWPRRAILAWNAARPGTGHTRGGRNVASRDALPRDEVRPRVSELLTERPDITAAQVHEQLGIHEDTASRVLVGLRAHRVQELLQEQPDLTARQVADRLGYHLRNATNALGRARACQRADGYRPYIDSVFTAAADAGVEISEHSGVAVRPGGICAIAARLGEQRPATGLVWDERYGWRTDPKPDADPGLERQPPTGPGIRYLARGITPDPGDVVAQLRDRRTGRKQPGMVREIS